ncbi:phage virion morphogenesis protein [Sphingomonas sp. CROZ-RG-20F-R02-07]|uniref:phage virion morphogenesis protein n=1 Tax=Sphingomonas sp. CROZ-RG-20F-R02-07 TaxID=2914832 RepID=UPI001F5A34B8|nr:phage virion morphogenesis protein [Sphingomonas sp. CROZ-RG-20F-R02-07]
MFSLQFNASAVFDQLDRARAVLDDLTPINEDIGEYMVKATRDRFVSSTAPDGSRWRKKSPTTIAAYLARGDGNRPNPLIGPSGRLGKEIAKLVARDAVEIGSALEYSGVMQDGAAKGAFGSTKTGRPVPWGDIPARVWLGISAEDERNILDIVDEHLELALDE